MCRCSSNAPAQADAATEAAKQERCGSVDSATSDPDTVVDTDSDPGTDADATVSVADADPLKSGVVHVGKFFGSNVAVEEESLVHR